MLVRGGTDESNLIYQQEMYLRKHTLQEKVQPSAAQEMQESKFTGGWGEPSPLFQIIRDGFI